MDGSGVADPASWPASRRLDGRALDQLFRDARTRNGWSDRGVPRQLLEELYALVSLGPTSANTSPARFLFVTSAEGKARLLRHVSAGNQEKVRQAPVCAVVGYDLAFAEHLVRLFPHAPGAAAWFDRPEVAQETAFRNGTLQGAYLILAARALGLDVGPLSGFDAAGVTAEFFAGTRVQANFLCNLGYGTDDALFPRHPRLSFEAAARLV
ncbi:MAG: nitroreductase [Phenylobacterium sp.]|nr:nitroreductase [Phenylobacterium sp.]